MYILMCGTGIGFSVERQYICDLSIVSEEFYDSPTVLTVNDSKVGWSAAYRELISLLYVGQVPKWNLDKVRAAGTWAGAERGRTFCRQITNGGSRESRSLSTLAELDFVL